MGCEERGAKRSLSDGGATSMDHYADGPGWSRSKAFHSWQAYLAGQEPIVLPRLVDRAGTGTVPPVLTIVAQSDPLRDEGIAWALRLADVGVPSELHVMPGAYHSALSASGTRTWARVQRHITKFLELFAVVGEAGANVMTTSGSAQISLTQRSADVH